MTSDIRRHCADMVLASAVQDLSESTGQSVEAVRNGIIGSPAYAALYDLETGLWGSGPDYFAAFYQECVAGGRTAEPFSSEGEAMDFTTRAAKAALDEER